MDGHCDGWDGATIGMGAITRHGYLRFSHLGLQLYLSDIGYRKWCVCRNYILADLKKETHQWDYKTAVRTKVKLVARQSKQSVNK